jgi:hypothetical protein
MTTTSTVLTEDEARATLAEALGATSLIERDPIELIRIGSNAVFYVGPDVVARIAPSIEQYENARKQIDVSRWLVGQNYPVTHALDIQQPVVANSQVVTFWRSISHTTRFASAGTVGSLVRRLHDLEAPRDIALPELEPFGVGQVPDFAGLAVADSCYLVEAIHWGRETFRRLPYALPLGHIHGDANVGNVILDDSGEAVVIDLDGFSVGPREWDLIQTAIFYDRLGWHSREEYLSFVEAYGYDLLRWDGYPELAKIREIAMTSWLSRRAAASATTAKEATKRIDAIRTGASRRDWGAY